MNDFKADIANGLNNIKKDIIFGIQEKTGIDLGTKKIIEEERANEYANKCLKENAKNIAENSMVILEELVDDINEKEEEKLNLTKESIKKGVKSAETIANEAIFNSSKQYIQDAINEYDYIHNEIWNNFPEMYNATKNLNDEFKDYYSTHNMISKIAAGESEPWKDVKTGKDAAALISNILIEAAYPITNEAYLSEIDSYKEINKGELDVINKVLDELEKINDDTSAVVEIYREELENAKEESADWMNKNSMENKLSHNKLMGYGNYLDPEWGEPLKEKYIENFNEIKAQAKEIEDAKAEYEAAKADFLKNEYEDEEKTKKLEELHEKFKTYYTACNHQIGSDSNGNLNSWLVDPNIQILSGNAKDVINNAAERISDLLGEDKELFTKFKEPAPAAPAPTEPTIYPTPMAPSVVPAPMPTNVPPTVSPYTENIPSNR